MPAGPFQPFLRQWQLIPDGEPIQTPTSHLLPVLRDGHPAMLKIATVAEEQVGADLMVWWQGNGSAAVLERDGDALLLERATGSRRLTVMSEGGQDDDACRIICSVAGQLHTTRPNPPPPTLVRLEPRFRALGPAAARSGGVLAKSAATARELLADPRDVRILHGDIHHANILDFGEHGWKAIDPKGLIGERGYDFANIFCNPFGNSDQDHCLQPGVLANRATVIANEANLDRHRLLQWVLAYAGLSAAWFLEEGADPSRSLKIASFAAAELGQIRG